MLIFWYSMSIVLMLVPNGLKVQGGLALITLFFCFILIRKRQLKTVNPQILLFFFICFSCLYVSVLWSHDVGRTIYELLKITPWVIGFIVISQLVSNYSDLRKISWVFVLFSVVSSNSRKCISNFR